MLQELKQYLMVGEQINAILFGVTYKKNEEFFLSDEYDRLIECLSLYDKKEVVSDSPDGDIDSNVMNSETDQIYLSKNTFNRQILNDRREYWEFRIKNFLTKSNEKWIIDQFNLCKKFLNQNSVEGHYDEFCHPIYNKFAHIQSFKAKCTDKRRLAKFNQTFTNLIRIHSQTSVDEPELRSENNGSYVGGINLKVNKCDIFALLKTLEEIENKIKMNRILQKTK